jgi:hypothetical protein
VEALSAAGANFDHTMCYINIIGVAAGGQAGGFDGVGTIASLGVQASKEEKKVTAKGGNMTLRSNYGLEQWIV